MSEDTKTFDLAELKEGETFFEEIYIEDENGKETLVAKSTLKLPKGHPGPSAKSAKPIDCLVEKAEYFTKDFQPEAASAKISDLGAIWEIVKPIGAWAWKNRKEIVDFITKEGKPIQLEDFDRGVIGIQPKHNVGPHDFYDNKRILSGKHTIKVRNWNGLVGVEIKGIHMVAFYHKTNTAPEDGKEGVPGSYIKKAYVKADDVYKGWGNYLIGKTGVNDVGNGADKAGVFDGSVSIDAHLTYGHNLWQRQTTLNFNYPKASGEKIYTSNR